MNTVGNFSWPRKVFGILMAPLVSGFLFATLLFCNLLQILSIPVCAISRTFFRRINCSIAGFWWGLCVFVTETIYQIPFVLTGDPLPLNENAVVIANHQQMPDVIALLWLGKRQKMIQNMKWMVKDVLKHVPGLGWGLAFLDSVFLKRHWDQDQKQIEAVFSKYKREKIPLWFAFFPEGTRITGPKLKRSQAFAGEHGLKSTCHVLLPRTKGFVASVSALHDHVTAVYDVTIHYEGGIVSLPQLLLGAPIKMHLNVRRFPIQKIPTGDALASWLRDRFYEKDTWITLQGNLTS